MVARRKSKSPAKRPASKPAAAAPARQASRGPAVAATESGAPVPVSGLTPDNGAPRAAEHKEQ